MDRDRSRVVCDTGLAGRIERAEAELITRASEAANRRRTATSAFVIPIAGGAGLRMAGGVAQLTGAATAPAHRRRGVQSALLAARLADAAAGCEIAVVTTQPASKSQQNVQRRGSAAGPGMIEPRTIEEASGPPVA